jgi:Flp pilus assembly protein TadG/cytoskeletal protein CcmA (bactofilin family)
MKRSTVKNRQIPQRVSPFLADQDGAIGVVIALLLPILFGFAGLAVDIGHSYAVKSQLKNAADAGALSGAKALAPYTSSTPNWAEGLSKAPDTVKRNFADNKQLTDCQVEHGYWNFTTNPPALQSAGIIPTANDYPAVRVTVTKTAGQNDGPVQMYLASILGVLPADVRATSVAIILQSQSGSNPFDFTIFSGSPSKTLSMNGSQVVKGSAHANHKTSINGSSNISGAVEGVNGVSINGSSTIGSVVASIIEKISVNGSNTIGALLGGAGNIDMPDYFQQMASTAAQVYDSNKVFNGSVNLEGSIFVTGKVTLNGSVSSTGAILATDNITVNGSSSISGSNQACIYSQNGNITINGSSFSGNESSEIIYAPNGKVTINGSFNFHGRIIAKEVSINGSANINGADYPVTTLPVPTIYRAALVQ